MTLFKFSTLVATTGLMIAAGCASTQDQTQASAIPAGLKAGEFVAFGCDNGKRMSARAAADGSSVRVRHEGGYELDRKEAGVYEADGWRFVTKSGTAELIHNGKTVLQNCKPA